MSKVISASRKSQAFVFCWGFADIWSSWRSD